MSAVMSPEASRRFRQNVSLTLSLIHREVLSRYHGTFMGIIWSFINPLILLAVYSVIFGLVFQSRWGGEEGATFDFALILFAGLIVFNLFSECANRAPTLIWTNPNYVRKIVFPLGIFPFVVIGTALFHAAISLIAWMAIYFFVNGVVHWTTVFVILIYVPLILTMVGLTFFLCSLGVYVRDIGQFTTLLTQSLLFLSPVFYSVEQAPGPLKAFLMWNPLTFVIEQSRAVMIYGEYPNWADLGMSTGVALVVAVLGYVWFEKTREGFADVV